MNTARWGRRAVLAATAIAVGVMPLATTGTAVAAEKVGPVTVQSDGELMGPYITHALCSMAWDRWDGPKTGCFKAGVITGLWYFIGY
jgi:hypothetical protein